MNVSTLKTWLKLQRSVWRSCRRHSMMIKRWPGFEVVEPIYWENDDPECIEIGHCVHVGPSSEISVLARSAYSKIPGRLRIGNRSWIGASCNIRAVGGTIAIGSNCLIAHQVSLIACNHIVRPDTNYCDLGWDETRTGVTIGDNVWVGCAVTILPGCNVGDNSVIGAGSIVTKSVPSGTVWAGNPARQLRKIE